MVFHEITKEAIQRAANETRELDTALVDAQETRRILDRLYGYEVRPVLWRKVTPGLSAGRVQSVATRMVVERERERMAFRRGVVLGRRGRLRTAGTSARQRRRSRHGSARSTARASPPAATSPTTARCAPRGRGPPRRGGRDPDRRAASARADVTVTDVAGEALHPSAVRAVHHLHAAAGGQPQAAPVQQERDARRPAAVRERLHHLHAYRQHHAVRGGAVRRAQPGPRPVRRGVRARRAAPLREEGQERPGGARGDPPRRRPVPHPGAGRRRAARRRVRALRADLEAHRRLADGRRRAAPPPPSGSAPRWPTAAHVEFSRQRHGHHLPRVPRGLRGGPRRRRRRPRAGGARRSAACPSCRSASASTCCGPRPTGTRPARRRATPRPRWSRPWRRRASAARRPTPRPSARSRTAATSTTRGSALIPTWLAFAVTRLLEEHFPRLVDYDFTASMEEDLDRIAGGDEAAGRVAEAVLLRPTEAAERRGAAATWSTTSARSTPARSRPSRSATASSCGSAATGPTSRRPSPPASTPPPAR